MATADAAMAVLSFQERMKYARELVTEGRRLLHNAHHDLDRGNLMVRKTHRLLRHAKIRGQHPRHWRADAGL